MNADKLFKAEELLRQALTLLSELKYETGAKKFKNYEELESALKLDRNLLQPKDVIAFTEDRGSKPCVYEYRGIQNECGFFVSCDPNHPGNMNVWFKRLTLKDVAV